MDAKHSVWSSRPRARSVATTSVQRAPSELGWQESIEDPERLARLLATGLLDSAPEEQFDRLTRLCAKVLCVPVALLSLVDARRQFFKSAVGVGDLRETPLSHSFCKYGVASDAPLIVTDARQVPSLQNNPAVLEMGAIAYAGVPVHSEGAAIGMFCVVDLEPRSWTSEEVELLTELARSVEVQVELQQLNVLLAERGRVLDKVLDTMPAGVIVRDPTGRILRTNPALSHVLGYSAREFAGMDAATFDAAVEREASPSEDASRDDADAAPRSVSRIERRLHKAGHWVWTRRSESTTRDHSGGVESVVSVVEDITTEHAAREALTRQMEVYRAVALSIPHGAVFLFDHDLKFLSADGPELLAKSGLDALKIVGKTLQELVSKELYPEFESSYRRALAGETVEISSERNGRTLLTRVAPVWQGTRVAGGVALTLDVSEERQQARAIAHAKALFEATIAHIHDGVAVIDERGTILLANAADAQMFGFEQSELVGMTRPEFLARIAPLSDDPEDLLRRMQDPVSPEAPREFVFVRPRRRVLRRTATPLSLPGGSGRLVIWHDITVESDLIAERNRDALTDVLTGIPNRRAAELALKREQSRAERAGTPFSLALFDIDHFKSVNDRYGHNTGDDVLRCVANALSAQIRLTDVVARWGGEEFIAVLPVPLDGARTFCERVRHAVETLRCAAVGSVTVSAGVVQLARGEDYDAAVGRADRCMYEAKHGGRNRVCG